jgi:hypothetical protein
VITDRDCELRSIGIQRVIGGNHYLWMTDRQTTLNANVIPGERDATDAQNQERRAAFLLQTTGLDRFDELALKEDKQQQRRQSNNRRGRHDIVPSGRVLVLKARNRHLYHP